MKLQAYDAVLGPSTDGGFYLIGFNSDSFSAGVLKDIKWSTNTVYAQTSKKLAGFGFNVYVLSHWSDIDTYADLKNLATSLIGREMNAPETSRYLKKNESKLFCNHVLR